MPVISMGTDLEQVFLTHLAHIKRAAEHACRRHHLRPEEAQDFLSIVNVKIIENDYEVLRKFEGKNGSSLKTYLVVVVQHQMQDYLNHLWGKWRPTAKARSLGPVAIQLEKLTSRDGLTFDQAFQILRINHHVDMSVQDLKKLADRLPPRVPRQLEGEGALVDIADPGAQADRGILCEERETERRKVEDALRQCLHTLPAQDRLIVKMRSEFSVVEIARALHLEQKPLYRRIEKILRSLRQCLEGKGVRAGDILDLEES